MTPDVVHAVLAHWFPGHDITVERAGSGTSTPVFAVHIGDETFFARLAEASGERRDAEVAVHRILTATGVPVPAIVRYEAAPPGLDRSLALTELIPGVALAGCPPGTWPPAVTLGAAHAAGAALARVNAVTVRGYGWVQDITASGDLVAAHPTRADWVEEYLAVAERVAASHILDPGIAQAVSGAVAAWCARPGMATSHLAHGDLDTTHLYVDPERGAFTGIIDFGEIRGADPLYDLGHLLLHDGEGGRPTILPSLLDGYAEITPLPADAPAAIRRQAIAIGARALAIQLGRAPSPYRGWLAHRLHALVAGGG